jgi:hypothetical protein
LVSIGLVLSEEKIFEKVYDVRRTTDDDDGRQVMAIAHMTLWVIGSGELKREHLGFLPDFAISKRQRRLLEIWL